MGIGNFFIAIFIVYYIKYIVTIFNKQNRQEIKYTNQKLEELRSIPVKTLEEQKEFINLKHPKTPPFKFKWKAVPGFIFKFAVFIIVIRIVVGMMLYVGIDLNFFHAIGIMMILPICINFILRKFDLQQSDISVFFRGGNKK